jgi:membrane complex biogenesis BtpA family protein
LELPRRGVLVGVNVLRNDALAALAVAAACDLEFIRVNVHTGAMLTDQGIVEGRAAVTVRERQRFAPEVAILADVLVKHATPMGSGVDIQTCARDTAYRGLADALIVTGKATGMAASLDDLRSVRSAVPDRPILVGSGVTPKTLRDTLRYAHGVIVGSAIKHAGLAENPVDPARAKDLVREARR